MTIEVTNTIHCDRVTIAGRSPLRCPRAWPVPVEQNLRDAVAEAKAAGWLVARGGRLHYCPDHRVGAPVRPMQVVRR